MTEIPLYANHLRVTRPGDQSSSPRARRLAGGHLLLRPPEVRRPALRQTPPLTSCAAPPLAPWERQGVPLLGFDHGGVHVQGSSLGRIPVPQEILRAFLDLTGVYECISLLMWLMG